jgi:hypothetical protein
VVMTTGISGELHDFAGRIEPVAARHHCIHDDNVGCNVRDLHRFVAIRCFSADFPYLLAFQQMAGVRGPHHFVFLPALRGAARASEKFEPALTQAYEERTDGKILSKIRVQTTNASALFSAHCPRSKLRDVP